MAKLTPREDQEWKIQRVLDEPTQAALIADDMGKGKTLMATEILLRAGWKRTLIIGIRDTGKQWAETVAAQSSGRVQVKIMNSKVEGEANFDAFMNGDPGVYFAGVQWLTSRDWEVIDKIDHATGKPIPAVDKKTGKPTGKNVTMSVHKAYFRRYINTKKRHVDAVIFDEIHKMQNRHSQIAGTVWSIKSDWRIGLSGTFAGNSFEGAWKVTSWLWPDLIEGSFNRWKERWATLEFPRRKDGSIVPNKNPHGDNRKIVGEREEGAYVASLPCYIRDEPDPVPPPRIVKVQLTPKQREQYDSLVQRNLAWLAANTPLGHEPLITDLPINKRQRLRTATLGEMRFIEEDKIGFAMDAASSKLNVTKYIVDQIWPNMPIIIGMWSVEFLKVAVARFRAAGYGAVGWHGGIPAGERQLIKERFIARDPSHRYLFCTIPSIGTGTDGLQKACSKMIWLEESESNLENDQFVKRSFRPGMTLDFGEFEHAKIVAEETIDEGILESHDAQRFSMRATLRAA